MKPSELLVVKFVILLFQNLYNGRYSSENNLSLNFKIMLQFWIIVVACTLQAFPSTRACDGERTEIEVAENPGFLSSPGYNSGKYPRFQNCMWEFIVPEDQLEKFIRFKFVDIELPKHRSCIDDYVQIEYYTSEETTAQKRFCGDKPPDDVVLPAWKYPSVVFYSGRMAKNMRGFMIEYLLVDEQPNCGEGVGCKYPFTCVPEESKCNGIGECYDGTDEENCDVPVETPNECGTPVIPPATGNDFDRIVGGRFVIKNSWPWHVSVQADSIYPSGHVCGGALINNYWVLTAAHCISSKEADLLRVKFGEHDLFGEEEGESIRYVQEIFVHEEYEQFKVFNDIALLKLKSPVTFNKYVSTVCLPDSGEELETGTMFHITGWGDTLVSGPSDILKQVMTPSIDWEKCRDMHAKNRALAPNAICTGYANGGQSPCFGDSGGPMVAQKNDKWTLYGIVSWGPHICGNPNEPSVMTKVSAYVDWISYTISKN